MYSVEIQRELNEIAQKYTLLFQRSVQSEFNKAKLRASGFLASSVRATYEGATEHSSPQIVIRYSSYGEYIGSRRLIWTKQPPVDKIKEWIEDAGAKFRRKALPGYFVGRSQVGISIDKQNTRIAFAIAKKLRFRQRLTRRYKWKQAALPDILREMNFDLINAWTKETETAIAKALSTK